MYQPNTSQLVLSYLVLLLSCAFAAVAQGVAPASPARRGDLPVGSTCTAEILNLTAPASADGRVTIPNVPGNRGLIRLRATCTDAQGNTTTGQSTLEVPVVGGETVFDDLTFDDAVAIPQGLEVTPQRGPWCASSEGIMDRATLYRHSS